MPRPASLARSVSRSYLTERRARGRLRWFVAYCNVNCEKRAALCLEARGYTVFLPLRTRWEKQFKRKVKVSRALFPRYLFFALRPGQDFGGLHHAHGVEKILRNGDMPVEAPQKAVDELRALCATDAFDETVTRPGDAPYRPGEAVEVVTGPWASLPAVVSRILSPESVEILVRLFGRESAVRVPLAALKEAC